MPTNISLVSPEPMYLYTKNQLTPDSDENSEFLALNSDRYEKDQKRMRSFYMALCLGFFCMFLGSLVGVIVLSVSYQKLNVKYDNLVAQYAELPPSTN